MLFLGVALLGVVALFVLELRMTEHETKASPQAARWRLQRRDLDFLPQECLDRVSTIVRRGEVLEPLLHSHNDYEQREPLSGAFELGFDSVEVDLWDNGGTLAVGHLPWMLRGSFRRLYLEPLAAFMPRLRQRLRATGRPLLLWMDFKESNPRLSDLVFKQLLSSKLAGDLAESDSPVRIVPTGSQNGRRHFLKRVGSEAPTRKSSWLASEWVALDWRSQFTWKGEGRIWPAEFAALGRLLAREHGQGRRVRFFGAPDGILFWLLAACAGVDMVGTDHPELLKRAITELRAFF